MSSINDTFVQQYYAFLQGRFSEQIIATKRLIEEQLNTSSLLPTDNIASMYPDIPFAEVLLDVGELFDISFSNREFDSMDGTLDSVIRWVVAKVGEAT